MRAVDNGASIFGDVNGYGVADFEIRTNGFSLANLTEIDFAL